MASISKIGTRQKFIMYLDMRWNMTYTKYRSLSPEKRREIMDEYQGRKK